MTPTPWHRPRLPAPGVLACMASAGAALIAGCQPAPPPSWSGYAEGDHVYVAAPVAGTLATLAVQAGQQVPAGAPLFTLDATPARAARAEAQARVRAAQAQADDAGKGRRPDELAVTRAQLAQARAQATQAEAEWRRQQALVAQGFISPARLDEATAARAQAHERVAELEAGLRVAALPARADARAGAQAQADAAREAQAQAEWREQQATQAAPAAGLVAETFWRPGEYVAAGQPVVALLPPAGRKARFYVPETAVGGLQLGQPVRLRCDGCGEPIAARISRIATQPEYTPPVIYANTQRAKLVFLVEARPEPADAPRLHPGQPLDVTPATP